MDIAPIKTKRDYRRMLKEVEGLMSAKRNTPEGDRLDVLVTLIEAWEAKHYPLDLPDPVSGKGVERHSSGSYQLTGGAEPMTGAVRYSISSSNCPYPSTASLTWSRFWMAHTRAGTGCTTGTCRSCSRRSMMSSVRQPEPSM